MDCGFFRELYLYGLTYLVDDMASKVDRLVNERKRGMVTLVSVDKSPPFFAELRSLMVKIVLLQGRYCS